MFVRQIRHDRPRHPTVVRDQFGDTLVEAYASPGEDGQTIKASEWEPSIRTIPHSEFPSASTCICQVKPKPPNRGDGWDTARRHTVEQPSYPEPIEATTVL